MAAWLISSVSVQLALAEECQGCFDLSSSERSITAGEVVQFESATIDLGGTSRAVTPGDLLTPAEQVALRQVLIEGQQSLQLTTTGAAASGTADLTPHLTQPLANLVIPTGITVSHDFGLSEALNISGTFINGGNFIATSSLNSPITASISAQSIVNLPNATIMSVTNGDNGIVNLAFNASQTIANYGVIQSAGTVSFTAAEALVNQGTISALTGNVVANTPSIQNNALMSAVQGNIILTNVIRPELGLLVSSGVDGVLSALNGRIDIGTIDSMAKFNTTISGGTLQANEILTNAGIGHLTLSVQDLIGPLSVSAGTASLEVLAGTQGFELRNLTLLGDPDLIYTGAGPFVAPSFSSDGGIVAINTSSDLINGSITFTGDIITTPTAVGPGGRVSLNAGTTISTGNITTTGNGAVGGSVELIAIQGITAGGITTGGGTVFVDSVTGDATLDQINSGFLGQPGGNVRITLDRGSLSITSSGITTSSDVQSGSARIITPLGSSVIVGGIDTSGALANEIAIVSNTLTIADNLLPGNLNANSTGGVGANIFVFTQGDAVLRNILSNGGNVLLNAGLAGSGGLTTGDITGNAFNGGNLVATSNGSMSLGNVSFQGGGGGVGGQIIAAVGNTGSYTLSTGQLQTSGITRGGQIVLVNASENGSVSTGAIISTSSGGLSGGDLSITAHGTISSVSINTSGGQAGGDVWLSSGATSGTAIQAGTVTTTAILFGGDFFGLIQPAATFSGSVNTLGTFSGSVFVGTPTSPQSSISGAATLSVSPGAVTGFNPGGFDSVNTAGNTLTLNQSLRAPTPIVSRSGITNISNLSLSNVPNGPLDIVSTGSLSIGNLTTTNPIAIFRAASTNGTVTLPSVSTQAGQSGGLIAAFGANGVQLPNGNSLMASPGFGPGTVGGTVLLGAPNGNVTLGQPGNASGNQINVSGFFGGTIQLVSSGFVTNNNVTLNTTGSFLPGRLLITQLGVSSPRTIPGRPPAAVVAASPRLGSPQPVTVALLPPLVLPNGQSSTILPTDTLPLSFSDRNSEELLSTNKSGTQLPIITTADLQQASNVSFDEFGLIMQVATQNSAVLAQGQAVFAPSDRLSIETKFATVLIAKDSIVLIRVTEKGLVVYDLHDTAGGAVAISNGNRTIELWPGRVVAVTSDPNLAFNDVGSSVITHREITKHPGASATAYTGEFSIASALNAIRSSNPRFGDNGESQRLASNVLKNAAIQMLSRNRTHTPFQ